MLNSMVNHHALISAAANLYNNYSNGIAIIFRDVAPWTGGRQGPGLRLIRGYGREASHTHG